MQRTTTISLGLFAAWACHDLEELFTMRETTRAVAARMPDWAPIPDDVRQDGLSQHLNFAISLMGAYFARVSGDLTDDRDPVLALGAPRPCPRRAFGPRRHRPMGCRQLPPHPHGSYGDSTTFEPPAPRPEPTYLSASFRRVAARLG
jgi:hypothetical protein